MAPIVPPFPVSPVPVAARPAAAWPLGFVSVDIDGLWALRSCYGQRIAGAFRRDPVWEEGVPWLLDTFDALGIRATFFVVARDLEVESKRARAETILRRGHELGNHSLSHRIGLTRLPMGELLEDLRAAQLMFEEALGYRPVGFRSPGYDIDARLLRAVRRVGFAYDSSLLPTWWAPLFRLADSWLARRPRFGSRQFGRFRYGWAPTAPFRPWAFAVRETDPPPPPHAPPPRGRDADGPGTHDAATSGAAVGDFWELPIGVTPRLRLPIGAGYVLTGGSGYLERALSGLERRGAPVSFLIHGADATDLRHGASRVFPARARQPSTAGFALTGDAKRHALRRALRELAHRLELVRMGDWVRPA